MSRIVNFFKRLSLRSQRLRESKPRLAEIQKFQLDLLNYNNDPGTSHYCPFSLLIKPFNPEQKDFRSLHTFRLPKKGHAFVPVLPSKRFEMLSPFEIYRHHSPYDLLTLPKTRYKNTDISLQISCCDEFPPPEKGTLLLGFNLHWNLKFCKVRIVQQLSLFSTPSFTMIRSWSKVSRLFWFFSSLPTSSAKLQPYVKPRIRNERLKTHQHNCI